MPECQRIDCQPAMELSPRRWLERGCACLARQLAELLGSVTSEEASALHSGIGFLLAYSERHLPPGQDFARIPSPPAGSACANLLTALELSSLELRLLLLAGMPEQHEGLAEVLAMVNPEKKTRPTVGLAAQLLSRDEQREEIEWVLAGNAVRSGLLRLQGDEPLYFRNLLLADQLWPVLAGQDVWPDNIVPADVLAVDWGLDEWFADGEVAAAGERLAVAESFTLRVNAEDRQAAVARAAALIRRSGRRAATFRYAALEPPALRCALLHCLSRGVVPLFEIPPADKAEIDIGQLAWFPGPLAIACCGGQAVACGRRPLVQLDVDRLGLHSLTRMWGEAMQGGASESAAGELASRFPVEPYIAAQVALDLERGGEGCAIADIARQIRVRAGIGDQAGVKLVRPAAGWQDLVLRRDSVEQLLEAGNRLKLQSRVLHEWGFLKDRHGARGVRMLFAGPPGTGKTLSAEVLANELGVDLLIVDISQLVSKWIGETEKNLEQAFLCAERTRAVLLFDEADALFGKRTEVSDAHDRYANLETAYLLTRLERFEGLAIMSTNLRGNIDPAFTRRMEFIIDFDEPGREERRLIWECHMPRTAPLAADVSFAELAAVFAVAGGAIRNAVVAAAFSAAAENGAISRAHLVKALQREYEKQGKSFPGSQRRV